MICTRCGKILEDGERFCPACGLDTMSAAAEAPKPMYGMECTQNDIAGGAQYSADQQSESSAVYKAPSPYEEKAHADKEFFGKGAFAFCLVVIGLLAASTGIFAGLYFSLLGLI